MGDNSNRNVSRNSRDPFGSHNGETREFDAEFDAEFDTKFETELETEPNTELNTELNSEFNSEFNTDFNTAFNAEFDTTFETGFETRFETGFETGFDAELAVLEPGQVLGGKYQLEALAGAGGMGVVWKAYDTVGERFVALKFVPKEIRHQEAAMARVKTAFQTIQELTHQHICPVYVLEQDSRFGYYVVMKWLEGKTLE